MNGFEVAKSTVRLSPQLQNKQKMGNLLGDKDIHEPDETNSMEGVAADIYQSSKPSEKEDSKESVAADNTHQSRKLTEEDNFEEGVEVKPSEKEDSKVGVAADNTHQSRKLTEEDNFEEDVEVEVQPRKLTRGHWGRCKLGGRCGC